MEQISLSINPGLPHPALNICTIPRINFLAFEFDITGLFFIAVTVCTTTHHFTMDNPDVRKLSAHEDQERKASPSDGVMSPSGSLTLSDSYVTPPEGSFIPPSGHLRSGTLDSFRSISTDTFFTPPGSESSRSRYAIKDILGARDNGDDSRDENVSYMLRDSSDSQKTVKSVVLANGKLKSDGMKSDPTTPVSSFPDSKGETTPEDQRGETSETEQSTLKRRKSVSLPLASNSTGEKSREEKMIKTPSSCVTTPSDKMTSAATTPEETSQAKKFLKGGTKALLIQKVGSLIYLFYYFLVFFFKSICCLHCKGEQLNRLKVSMEY